MNTPDLLDAILDALRPHGLRPAGPATAGQWKANPPWRPGADDHNLSVTRAPEYGGGCKWYDYVEQRGGNGVQLAKELGLTVQREPLSRAEKLARRADRPAAYEQKRAELQAEVERHERWAREAGAWIARLPPVTADPVAVLYLAKRGLSAEAAALAGMVSPDAGPSPHGDTEPRYSNDRRLIIPVVDCTGQVVGYRGRATTGQPRSDKERGPKGMAADHPKGRVYACPRLRAALQGQARAVAELRAYGLLIVEGGPDMVATVATVSTWAAPPMVMGVYGGGSGGDSGQHYSLGTASLFREGGRIPADVPLCLLTHADPAGHRYAAAIASQAGGEPERVARLYRPREQSWPAHPTKDGERCDVADLYQTHGPEAVAALILSATTLAKTGQGWTQAEPLAPEPPTPAPELTELTAPPTPAILACPNLPERTPAAAAIVALAQGQGVTSEAWQAIGAELAELQTRPLKEREAWWDTVATGMTQAEREAWGVFDGVAIVALAVSIEQTHGVECRLIHLACWQVRRAVGVTP